MSIRHRTALCIDEKPAIQALERPHASELTRNAIKKVDFHYKRHGVLNLFAAFSVNDGMVYGKTPNTTKRCVCFVTFDDSGIMLF